MFISKEEAMAAASGRHKLKTCRAGQGWLICPYVPGAVYSNGHWVPQPIKRWMMCNGEFCSYHHLPLIVKAHVPALVSKRALRIPEAEKMSLEKELVFRGEHWGQKIVEITAGCFPTFDRDSKPDQLAIIWRPGPANNGPLSFRWLDTTLREVPQSLAHFNVKDILPAIMHGEIVLDSEPTLTEGMSSRIKHNSNSEPLKSARSPES